MRFLNILTAVLILLAGGLRAQSGPCEIYDLSTVIGTCTSDSTHKIRIDFQTSNATSDSFEVYTVSNTHVGTFALSQLPLELDAFPTNNSGTGFVKVYIQGNPDCARIQQFLTPVCNGPTYSCTIENLYVHGDQCNNDNGYNLQINFQTDNPGTDSFSVYNGNGQLIGVYAFNQLPLTIQNYPWNGASIDTIQVCIPNAASGCCKTREFNTPNCFNNDCFIGNIKVEVGNCNSDSTYELWLTFLGLANTNIDSFEVYSATGVGLGTYAVTQLPLHLAQFPWNGESIDYVKICAGDSTNQCCLIHEFNAPDCSDQPCGIYSMKVRAFDCNQDGTYKIQLGFFLTDTTGIDSFTVYAGNGALLGTYGINQLPIQIDHFPWAGHPYDVVKVCITLPNGNICCKERTFLAPPCITLPCNIQDLSIQTGDCSSDSTYVLHLNFGLQVPNVGVVFGVWANGEYFGQFQYSQLPLTITNFPYNGGQNDEIQVCIGVPGAIACCATLQFPVPPCILQTPCNVYDLVVDTGDCTSDSSYVVHVNFGVSNPGNASMYSVWANNAFFGSYPLNQLPLTITNFPYNGGANDVIKVCIGANSGIPTCCESLEFPVPACVQQTACNVYDLSVETGDCTSDSSYVVHVNFGVNNPGNATMFSVWANNAFFGSYPLNQLPLTITNFPYNGGANDVIKVCIGTPNNVPSCCETLEFPVPPCILQGGNCDINGLGVDTGACTSDSTYVLHVNFQVVNPGAATEYTVYANGNYFGVYPLTQIPLIIQNFPYNGGLNDVIKVCIGGPNAPSTCCAILEFPVPACILQIPCNVYDLVVDTGDCTSDSTYVVHVNFGVSNPGNATVFSVWANNAFFGTYPLNQLPLTITNFPYNGGQNDVIKVCVGAQTSAPTCCETLEFPVPSCILQTPCNVYDLSVVTGDCTSDSTYVVHVNFGVNNPGNATMFSVWANNVYFGTYLLGQLPLTITNFPYNGGANDVIRVCINTIPGAAPCCETLEFPVPPCILQGGNCDINDLGVDTGACTSDSTYVLHVNFQVVNPGTATQYTVYANGNYFGTYPLTQIPLIIQNFPYNGGLNDVIKICIGGPNAPSTCCAILEFPVPSCILQMPCDIFDLTVQTGDCTSDSTYVVHVNFHVSNPGNATTFALYANGNLFGNYMLSQLPLTITNFPYNGGLNDVIKVCLGNTAGTPNCCETIEFPVPPCILQSPCDILNLSVQTGDCTSDSTYVVHLNFQVANPGNNQLFVVWANGNFFGTYNLSQLPLTIPNFPYNGGQNDVVKVCIGTPNAPSICCATLEFPVPPCILQPGSCDIHSLTVQTGDCNPDGTYNLWVNFQVSNPTNALYEVWANGQYLGFFPLAQLPLHITSFPASGGNVDVIKVCLNDNPNCCATLEFLAPDCPGLGCHIYDLQVLHTPCLCGQFFALLTFQHTGANTGSFDVMGNGNNYGNFPYTTPQPIIIGPLLGDGTTVYEFVVRDHAHQDCADDVTLGTVECDMVAVHNPGDDMNAMLIAPNPASNTIQVTAHIAGLSYLGQADVDIIQADGRVVRSVTVSDASNFGMDVSDLPSGFYHLLVKTASGRLDGSFAKQ